MKRDFDLYSDSYLESLNGTFEDVSSLPEPLKNYGSINTFIRGCLVLLLRVGFVLVQLGSVPTENVHVILLHNIIDMAISIISFGLVGNIFAFGSDSLGGIIGYSRWMASGSADLDNAILGFSACIMATGLITTILSGRFHFVGYLLTSILFSMVVQPTIMHWVWHDNGWMRRMNLLGHQVSIKDHAGGLVVHLTGGLVGLMGALFLGRRLLKLSDIDECSIGAESPGSTISGYIFIALGLIGFSLPSPNYELTHIPYNYIGTVLINNILAMASGIIVVVIMQFLFFRETFNYWIILRCMQGAIAGMVSIASGVDVYTPIFAFLIASGSAVLFYFVALCVHNSSVEDYCNIIAIHLTCGFVSTVLPPIFGSSENLGASVTAHFRIIHLGWQLLSLFTIACVLIIIFSLLFSILLGTGFLRNKAEEINHRRGVTVAVKGPDRCFLQRLFTIYSQTPYIEPGVRGKSPDQYQSYQKADVPKFTVTPKTGKLQVKEAESAEVSVGKEDADDIIFKTVETTKKPRFVYTLPSIVSNPFQKNPGGERFDSLKCSGDSAERHGGDYFQENTSKSETNRYLDVAQKLSEVFQSPETQRSCYELHKTKKYMNLFRNRRAMRKRGLQLVQEGPTKSDVLQSTEFMLHDKIYDDGFITIKMPCVQGAANLSDGSDS